MLRVRRSLTVALVLLVAFSVAEAIAHTGGAPPAPVLAPQGSLTTGILHDRIVSLVDLDERDGSADSAPSDFRTWRQMLHEMRRASLEAPAWPSIETIRDRQAVDDPETILLGILHLEYEKILDAAWADGSASVRDGAIVLSDPSAVSSHRLFAVAPMKERSYRGAQVAFRIPRELVLTNSSTAFEEIVVDFADGLGFRPVTIDQRIHVRYARTGEKAIRIRVHLAGGTILRASTRISVPRLQTPVPDDTLSITAAIPYLGEAGTGDAYVYLADAHSALTDPILMPEGFDLDNSMYWDELYDLLNREVLLETIRAAGFDVVILNFTDATTYIQRNAFVLVELMEQIRASIDPSTDIAVAGPSMGGLVARYALAYRETNGYETNERVFVSFDAPQAGADIPLGIQYWLAFFADQSADAAALLEALDSPAARQLLLTHHTDPPQTIPTPDPLRAQLLADLDAVGGYPALLRRVAISNGTGSQQNQGYAAGAQIIEWEYESILIDVTGNCWAVPDMTSHVIFHGLIDPILFPADEQIVTVSGTRPYDNAPGGWRDSMADMDMVEAPFGDIIALQANHCFIPSISALALDTEDPFYDIAGDPDLLAHTPFDAVYYPTVNEEHVQVTPQNKQWILDEVLRPPVAVHETPLVAPRIPQLHSVFPNPVGGVAKIGFDLPLPGQARLAVYDLSGRRIADLENRLFEAGTHQVVWDGLERSGREVAPGVYLLRLEASGGHSVRKVVRR